MKKRKSLPSETLVAMVATAIENINRGNSLYVPCYGDILYLPISAAEKSVLLVIQYHCYAYKGQTHPSLEVIGRLAGCNKATAQRSVKRLCALGLIGLKQKQKGYKKSNYYFMKYAVTAQPKTPMATAVAAPLTIPEEQPVELNPEFDDLEF